MRTIKEIFKLALKCEEYYNSGLCQLFSVLEDECIITPEELLLINNYLQKNRPLRRYNLAYWFKPYIWTYRERWIKKQIKKLS